MVQSMISGHAGSMTTVTVPAPLFPGRLGVLWAGTVFNGMARLGRDGKIARFGSGETSPFVIDDRVDQPDVGELRVSGGKPADMKLTLEDRQPIPWKPGLADK